MPNNPKFLAMLEAYAKTLLTDAIKADRPFNALEKEYLKDRPHIAQWADQERLKIRGQLPGMTDKQARQVFMAAYLCKQADLRGALGEATNKVVGRTAEMGTSALLLAPAVAGVLGGSLASRLTTPSGESAIAQKSLIAAELEETLAEMKRKRSIETIKRALRDGQEYTGRSLHL